IRTNALVLEREPGAGATEPGLHLIENEKDALGVAEAAQPSEPAGRRHDDAGLALNGLDQHRRRPRPDRALDGGKIAERDGAETRRERAKAVTIIRFARERDHRRGAAVEIAVGDNDLGAVADNALDAIAPAARGLDRGLDRFRTGIHRQRGIEAGQLANLREEGGETVIEKSARGHGEAARLRGERRENS